MFKRRTRIWILLCGIAIFTAYPLCHAQDTETQSVVKRPQETVSPVLLPETINTPLPLTAEVKPAKSNSEVFWLWRLLEGLTMGAARYNTEKQSDGRPQAPGNFR